MKKEFKYEQNTQDVLNNNWGNKSVILFYLEIG